MVVVDMEGKGEKKALSSHQHQERLVGKCICTLIEKKMTKCWLFLFQCMVLFQHPAQGQIGFYFLPHPSTVYDFSNILS